MDTIIPDRFFPDSSSRKSKAMPSAFHLAQNYPNPFNPRTTLTLYVDRTQFVDLTVYDPLGRPATVLCRQVLAPGHHRFEWAGDAHPSGVYFVRARGEAETKVMRMILVK